MPSKARLFVGVRVALESVESVSEMARAMKVRADDAGLGVRWVAPALYHVTLKFIGWVRDEAVLAYRDALAETLAGEAGFSFRTRGAGAFPKPERARVLWAGIDDTGGRLAGLAAAIDGACAALGTETETRAYHPHVTVGRIKKPGDASKLVAPFAGHDMGETRPGAVILFESKTKPGGSEYIERASFPLEPRRERSRHTRQVQGSPRTEESAGDEPDGT